MRYRRGPVIRLGIGIIAVALVTCAAYAFWRCTPGALRSRQHAAIARIEARGGKVIPRLGGDRYPEVAGGFRLCTVDFSHAALSGDDLLLLDALEADIALTLADSDATDSVVQSLGRLRASQVRIIDLSGTRITDNAAVTLRGLDPTYLDLSRTEITNAAVAGLSGLQHLGTLHLSGTHVDDRGLESAVSLLAAAPSAWEKDLDVSYTMVSDKGLIHLARIPLNRLDLSGTKITDVGLRHLGSSEGISDLFLANTLIGDDGMGALAAVKDLRVLDIRETRVSDVGLRSLRACRTLSYVDLRGCNVSQAGIKPLRDAIPGLTLRGPEAQ